MNKMKPMNLPIKDGNNKGGNIGVGWAEWSWGARECKELDKGANR